MRKAASSLQDLRRRLYVKAKTEGSWRFWGLYVHVCQRETLREAYRLAKRNNGAPGIDGVTALRLRPIKRSSESRNPSVWRSGRLKTTRSVNAVRTARFEYRRWPPRRPFFGGTHAAIASSLSQIVTSPRLLRPRSYSLQFRILYFFLYWRLTRLDFAATTTLPPRSL